MSELGRDENGESGRNYGRLMLWIAICLVTIWLLFYPVFAWLLGSSTDLNEVGDAFGAFNALVSGLAFGALLVTLLMQMEELRLQRADLRLTRKEVKRSADAQTSMVRLGIQQFVLEHGVRSDLVITGTRLEDGTQCISSDLIFERCKGGTVSYEILEENNLKHIPFLQDGFIASSSPYRIPIQIYVKPGQETIVIVFAKMLGIAYRWVYSVHATTERSDAIMLLRADIPLWSETDALIDEPDPELLLSG